MFYIFHGHYDNPKDYDVRKVVVIACNAEDARRIIASKLGLRRNASGLSVNRIPYKEAKRVYKSQEELIPETSYRPGLGSWDSSHYGTVTRCHCSHCNKEIKVTSDFCVECGSYFIN